MPDSMIARLGLDTNYLFAALAAMVILIQACTVGANLPHEMAE